MPGYDLKIALQKLTRKQQNFALYRGEEGDQIFLSPRPPTPKQLEEIESDTGEGKRILKGVCFKEEAGLIFASRTAAPAWEKMLTKVLQVRKCAQFLPLVLRQLGENEAEEATGDEVEPAAAPKAATSAGQVQWETMKASYMPHLRSALADPATKEKVVKVVTVAQASEKAGDYAGAIAIFERLASVLQISVPPPVVEKPAEVKRPENVRPPKPEKLQAAMNKLTPVFKAALSADPGRKGELLRPVVQFQKLLADGQLEEARAVLRQVGRALQSAL